MAVSTTGTVPETSPDDPVTANGRADALDDPQLVAPTRDDEPSGIDVASGGGSQPREIDAVDVELAIQESVRENGAGVTRDRILDGTLQGPDGRPVLDDLSTEDRLELVGDLTDGIRARANATVEISSETSAMMQYESRTVVQGALEPGFENPQEALQNLRSLGDAERQTLREGDASVLGELKPGADVDTNALAAYAEMWNQNRGAADQVRAYESRQEAIEQMDELGEAPAPGRHRSAQGSDDLNALEPDPGKQAGLQDMDPQDRMAINIQQAAMAPQMI